MTKANAPVATEDVPAFPDIADAFDDAVVEVVGADEEQRLVPMVIEVPEPQHHIVTGMGTLAALSDEDFAEKLAIMKAGQERVRIIQKELLVEGEDYGKVRGIDRPFLHQPGAEKLANFYGLAIRQEADRLIGDGISSPPLAYHVRSYVHVGSLDGPVVAMGYGEASSWEEKYRYRYAKAVCPNCQREGMIKGKPDGQLKGKYWCPKREGGCNSTFEPADERVVAPGKVENTDPHSLAETIIQMAGKRSFVAAIRRATGTSGLFTQDEDSPSVRQQSADADPYGGDVAVPVEVTAGTSSVAPGGKTTEVTEVQMRRLVTLSKEKDLGPSGIASLLSRLFDISVDEETSPAVSLAVRNLTATQLGQLLMTIETGDEQVSQEAR